ncbi:MAG: hypothetical protein QOI77_2009 [Blastocatellia bacterium]|jgi:hypothetical protein|nr:hypothetical protein [Blastocatellia bacterium]
MKRNNNSSFSALLIMLALATLVVFVSGVNTQAQKTRAVINNAAATTQQPLYTDYKGVRLGMTAGEARTRLGKAAFSDKDLDYYVISETETVQIAIDAQGKVKAISVDYMNGTGAPDPKTVVGADLEPRPDGTLYRMVRYESQGFWVSYSRAAGPVVIVTVTIQKM